MTYLSYNGSIPSFKTIDLMVGQHCHYTYIFFLVILILSIPDFFKFFLLNFITCFPQLWERLRGSLEERSRRTTFCASGLHPNGTCSCGTFSRSEESGIHASISRIVMLAEALFEVVFFLLMKDLDF